MARIAAPLNAQQASAWRSAAAERQTRRNSQVAGTTVAHESAATQSRARARRWASANVDRSPPAWTSARSRTSLASSLRHAARFSAPRFVASAGHGSGRSCAAAAKPRAIKAVVVSLNGVIASEPLRASAHEIHRKTHMTPESGGGTQGVQTCATGPRRHPRRPHPSASQARDGSDLRARARTKKKHATPIVNGSTQLNVDRDRRSISRRNSMSPHASGVSTMSALVMASVIVMMWPSALPRGLNVIVMMTTAKNPVFDRFCGCFSTSSNMSTAHTATAIRKALVICSTANAMASVACVVPSPTVRRRPLPRVVSFDGPGAARLEAQGRSKLGNSRPRAARPACFTRRRDDTSNTRQ
mmetsp:Transcript_33691/g.103376  ORF Transcript_33691/g.103376 Transcript_33691/m.103376 type:complete len:357 (+) Transcript_33691:467-1537(+)